MVCISDDEGNLPSGESPKETRRSRREEAGKEIDYNTKRHPQDDDIPGMRKLKKAKRGQDSATNTPVKRRQLGGI